MPTRLLRSHGLTATIVVAGLGLSSLSRAGDADQTNTPPKPVPRWSTVKPSLAAIETERSVRVNGLSAVFQIPVSAAIFERVLVEHELRRGPFRSARLARRMCVRRPGKGRLSGLAIMGGGNFQVNPDERLELVHELRPRVMGSLGFDLGGGAKEFEVRVLEGEREVRDGVIHERCGLRFTFDEALAIDVEVRYRWRPPTRLSELPVEAVAVWRGPVAVHEALPAAAKLY